MITLKYTLSILCGLLAVAESVAAGGIDVPGGLTRAYTVESGQKIEGTIVLRNKTDKPQEVKAYQADYLFSCDGSNIYGEPGSVPRSNSSWITFSPQQLVVPARDTASIYFTIQVPSEGKLMGTYWSMMMVEPLPEGSPELMRTQPDKVTVGVQTIMRYAIQMVTTIGSSGASEIGIIDKHLAVEDGKNLLQLDVENKGERWLTPSVRADIYDSKGAYVGRFEGRPARIYPGCSVRHKVPLDGVAAGKYNALIVLDNGDEAVWGARYKLEIK